MTSSTVIFTILYILMSVCYIFPPSEFVSAGFTVQYIFANWLGSEDLFFIEHHVRRTVATLVSHSLLPLGYLFGLSYFANIEFEDVVFKGSLTWKMYCLVAIVLPIAVACTVWSWSRDRWKSHPLSKTLALYATGGNSWKNVASDIDTEFRRIDKISIETSTVVKIIATDNWIIKVMPYHMNVIHQSDVALVLTSSDHHSISPHSPGGAQFLNIEVKSVRPNVGSFGIRLNSLDFKDLQEKVHRPIVNIQNIPIHRTLSDRFLEAFRAQVQENPRTEINEETEPCIGCMQTASNIKLQKLCEDSSHEEPCVMCYCRPMWCIDCMGKWFASRQNQNHPETWLASKCPCPTCRSRFCMLDVCLIEER